MDLSALKNALIVCMVQFVITLMAAAFVLLDIVAIGKHWYFFNTCGNSI